MEALEQKVLWCAAKYALCLEEGDAVEAVLHTLRPKVGELSDKTLAELLTAVEAYVHQGRQFEFDAKYLPEWSDALAWLLNERKKREEESK